MMLSLLRAQEISSLDISLHWFRVKNDFVRFRHEWTGSFGGSDPRRGRRPSATLCVCMHIRVFHSGIVCDKPREWQSAHSRNIASGLRERGIADAGYRHPLNIWSHLGRQEHVELNVKRREWVAAADCASVRLDLTDPTNITWIILVEMKCSSVLLTCL